MSPTVRRIVLFKHGVAYVERGGPCAGSFELSFQKTEMNDVLKSLAVWVPTRDARVTAVAFDKPENPEDALEEKGLNFPDDRSLFALLTAMRGRRGSLRTEAETITGEIVGVESRSVPHGQSHWVVVSTGPGEIRVIPLDAVLGATLDDPTAAADLGFFLDRRRAATSRERRAVRIGIEGKSDDVRVAYVIPAPVWRVSYRILGTDENALLLAWAIVHNPLDENVEAAQLTLTTGQPISFDINLYEPKTVQRVLVEESSRALAAGPASYARGGQPAAAATERVARSMVPMMAGMPPPPPGAPAPAAFGMAQAMDGAHGETTNFEDRGELFEYAVAEPVSLRRGASALVPLLSAKVSAKKERIWRENTPSTPDLVLAFKNETGAVLEEGPAVVYENEVYAGESMVPYSARGSSLRFAFAKDLAVRCQKTVKHDSRILGVQAAQKFVYEQQRLEQRITLRADSDHATPTDVIFELGKRAELDPAHAMPFEETATHRRFRMTVPAQSFAELSVVEVSANWRRVEGRTLSPSQLEQWNKSGLLTPELLARLDAIVKLVAHVAMQRQKAAGLERDRQKTIDGQNAIAKQLEVLREGGKEGELRLRYVGELAAAQDQANSLASQAAALLEAAERDDKSVDALIEQLVAQP